MNAYDEVLYHSQPFRKSHVDRLATIATLHGLAPPSIKTGRVLELGCAMGSNLLPMAEQLPEAQFVGFDGSARQIEIARETAAAAGLTNVKLVQGDLREIGRELGEFDYVIAHGIYSWVPSAVQKAILAICGDRLAARGVAYVSYNCYPGWHLRGTVHHLLRYATRDADDVGQSIRQARQLAETLASSIGIEGSPDDAALKQELELVGKQKDSYLFHEYLAEVNEPVYFHEFIERAGAKGLQYLGDTEFGLMSPHNLPPPIKQYLGSFAPDSLQMEQYLDFIKNRKFRQTLLCRREVTIDRPDPERVRTLYVASGGRAQSDVDLASAAMTSYRNSAAMMTSGEPIIKAAMLVLSEHWPRAIAFGELLTAACARLPAGLAVPAEIEQDAALLTGMLLTGFSTGLVELSTQPSAFTLTPSERPVASPLARYQAQSSVTVTNRRHETIPLEFFQQLMLRFLDSKHDRSAIVAGLLDLVKDETLVIHDAGQRVMDGARAGALVTEAVTNNLTILGRLALLVA